MCIQSHLLDVQGYSVETCFYNHRTERVPALSLVVGPRMDCYDTSKPSRLCMRTPVVHVLLVTYEEHFVWGYGPSEVK